MAEGVFISLDGVDGAGKSTQCRMLVERLQAEGLPAVACRDPGGTPVGERIRTLLLETGGSMSLQCEALLYMASRAELIETVIRPALAAGKVVVSDRFLLANVVYQGHGGGLEVEPLRRLCLLAAGGLTPDLTLVLDVSPADADSRRKPTPDRLEARGSEFQSRVRQGFLAEAAREPDRIRVIDGSGPADAVAQRVYQEVRGVLEQRRRA